MANSLELAFRHARTAALFSVTPSARAAACAASNVNRQAVAAPRTRAAALDPARNRDRQAARHCAHSRRSDQGLRQAPRRRSGGGLASALGRSPGSDDRERQPNRGPVAACARRSAPESGWPSDGPIRTAKQALRWPTARQNPLDLHSSRGVLERPAKKRGVTALAEALSALPSRPLRRIRCRCKVR
jgi:hypothetical protein